MDDLDPFEACFKVLLDRYKVAFALELVILVVLIRSSFPRSLLNATSV